MHCAIAGLRRQGYRLPTSRPGHHQTALQTLGMTLGVDATRVAALDALRRRRHGIDYEGDPVSLVMAKGCIEAAAELVDRLTAHMERA